MIKILYVEDEPFLAKIVKESLESRNFQVEMVQDGQQVMAAYQRFKPHICVLDVMLPNVDGFTLGQQIRATNEQIPIIYLTAKNQTHDLLKGFQSGGNDYIRKPFSMEELIVRIQNLLQLTTKNSRPSIASDEAIQIGVFTFYPKKYELCQGEKCRKLSYREVQLLNIFATHPNQAIDRKKILMEVWGDDSFFNSRNLDVYIRKLRGYFKADDKVRIVTLKGVGYHFIVEK